MVDSAKLSIDTTSGRLVLPEILAAEGTLKSSALIGADQSDTVVLAIQPAAGDDGVRPTPGATHTALRYGIDLADLAQRREATGAAGECISIDLPRVHARHDVSVPWDAMARRIILLGIGDGTRSELRTCGAALWRHIKRDDRVVIDLGPRTGTQTFAKFATGLLLGAYQPRKLSAAACESSTSYPQVVLLAGRHRIAPLTEALATARTVVMGTWLARDLANTPSNIKTPQWFADQCAGFADAEGLHVTVHDETWLTAHGFGATLAVGSGSAQPPRLVVVDYDPAAQAAGQPATQHVVIVGKGITYDTGGISLKPRASMTPMKTDMAGAAAAVSTAVVASRLGLPQRVTVVVPLAENAMSGSAYRPGDVVHAANGTSIEVTNTDAEGRLVLADAMSWAVQEFQPDAVIDVATLTGAAKFALGDRHAALFSDDDDLAAALVAASDRTHESVWRLPLVDNYREGVKSPIADIRQTGDPALSAGSIMAALFLQHFVPTTPWAHLDIAGAARAEKPRPGVTPGSTGYGVALLAQYLLDGAGREQ